MKPISPELLLDIFSYCTSESNHRSDAHWDAISQTCSSWRALALSTPSLWTSIDDAPTPIAKELLKRSKNHSISVSYECRFPEHLDPLFFVLNHAADRVRVLYVLVDTIVSGSWTHSLLSTVEEKLPLLEHLSLTLPGLDDYDVPIPLQGSPRLKSLHMSITGQRLTLPLRTGIITLFTYLNDGSNGNSGMELQSAVGLLRAMPQLQELDIVNLVSLLASNQTSAGLGIVQLNCLKKVHIKQDGKHAGYFLAALVIPPTAHSSINLGCALDEVEDAPTFFSNCLTIISPRVGALVDQQHNLVIVCTTKYDTLEFSITILGRQPRPGAKETPLFAVRVSISGSSETGESFHKLRFLCHELDLFPLSQLYVDFRKESPNIPYEAMLTILSSFTRMRTLRLSSAKEGLIVLLRHLATCNTWCTGDTLSALERVDIDCLDEVSLVLARALNGAFSTRPPRELHFVNSKPLNRKEMETLGVCAGSITFGQGQ